MPPSAARTRRRTLHALVGHAFAALAVAPSSAWADPKLNVALDYERGAGAEACPDARAFEPIVRARVGRDPFVSPAKVRARIRIVGKAGALVGTLEVDGSRAREIRSASRDCDELVASLALALAIRIDPASLVPTAPTPTPVPAELPAARASEPGPEPERARVAAPPASSSPESIALRASIGAVAAIGSGPGATGGMTVQLGIRWRDTSLGVEGRADLPTDEVGPSGGRVRAGLLAGSVVPCLHHGILLGCLLATAGVLRTSGESVEDARTESVPFVAMGARLGAEISLRATSAGVPALSAPFSLRFHADALAPLTRPTLRLDGAPVWRAPALSGALGAAFVATF